MGALWRRAGAAAWVPTRSKLKSSTFTLVGYGEEDAAARVAEARPALGLGVVRVDFERDHHLVTDVLQRRGGLVALVVDDLVLAGQRDVDVDLPGLGTLATRRSRARSRSSARSASSAARGVGESVVPGLGLGLRAVQGSGPPPRGARRPSPPRARAARAPRASASGAVSPAGAPRAGTGRGPPFQEQRGDVEVRARLLGQPSCA